MKTPGSLTTYIDSKLRVYPLRSCLRLTEGPPKATTAGSLRWYSTSSRDTIRYRARLLGWQTALFNWDAWSERASHQWKRKTRARSVTSAGDDADGADAARAGRDHWMRLETWVWFTWTRLGLNYIWNERVGCDWTSPWESNMTNEISLTFQLDRREENKCAAFSTHVYSLVILLAPLLFQKRPLYCLGSDGPSLQISHSILTSPNLEHHLSL